MKIGTIAHSIESPVSGFTINREGFSIYAQYIPEDSITTIFIPDMDNETSGNEMSGHTEYEYMEYSLYEGITSYEELIAKLVALKYTIEDEMSLTNKMIANECIEEYEDYRLYVSACKNAAKANYVRLGLNKIDN